MTRPRFEPHEQRPTRHEASALTTRPHVLFDNRGNSLVLTRVFFVNNEIYMAFLLNFQAQGVFGKNEQSTQTPWPGAPEAQGPMQLHRFKAGPV